LGHLGPRETNGWPDGQWQSAGSWIVGFSGVARQRCRHCPQPGAPRACCLFGILFGILLSLCAHWHRVYSAAGAAGCWGVGRGVRDVGPPSRSPAWRGSAVSSPGNAAGASELDRARGRERDHVRSGAQGRPRADHADSTMLDHPIRGFALDPVSDPCAQVGPVPASVIRSELRALVRISAPSPRIVIPRQHHESPANVGTGQREGFPFGPRRHHESPANVGTGQREVLPFGCVAADQVRVAVCGVRRGGASAEPGLPLAASIALPG